MPQSPTGWQKGQKNILVTIPLGKVRYSCVRVTLPKPKDNRQKRKGE